MQISGIYVSQRKLRSCVNQILARTLIDVVATVWKGKVYHVQTQRQRTAVFLRQ